LLPSTDMPTLLNAIYNLAKNSNIRVDDWTDSLDFEIFWDLHNGKKAR